MKETIRIKLTMDAEKALSALLKVMKTKKNVIDLVVKDNCNNLLKRFSLPRITGSNDIVWDTRRIEVLKAEFKTKSGAIKTYAISPDAKARLSTVSKALKVNMGITLSILLEDLVKALVQEVERQPEEDKILKELAALKESISSDVNAMNDLWYKLLNLYPDDEESSPFYHELMIFFDGFNEFSP